MNPIIRNFVAVWCLLAATFGLAEETLVTNPVAKIIHSVRDAKTHAMLQAIAQEKDPAIRTEAIGAFCLIHDSTNATSVRAALRDPESSVRAQAIEVASLLSLSLSPAEAKGILQDPEESVRTAFFAALPGLKIENKPQFVVDGLEDSSVEVRQAAAAAAPQLPVDPAILEACWQNERDPLTAGLIYAALLSEASVDTRQSLLRQGLSSSNAAIVVVALRDVQPDDKVADEVVGKLSNPAVIVSHRAVRATQRLAYSPAIPTLLSLLQSDDANLRRAVCEALAAIPAETRAASVTALAERLARDADPFVRRAAAEALTAIHDDAAKEALETLLHHEQPAVRRDAVLALGRWAEPAAAPALHSLLEDPDIGVAAAAAEALGTLKNFASQAPLLQRLASGPPLVQERIAYALGQSRTVEAVPDLVKLLQAGDAALETTAAQALGQIGDPRAVPPLQKNLFEMTSHVPEVRMRSIEALRLLGDRETLPRVFAIVTERVMPPPLGINVPTYDNDHVRIEGLRYLAAFGDAQLAEQLWGKFTETPTWDLRVALAETLHALTGKRYQPISDEDYRRYSVESLEAATFIRIPPPPGVLAAP